MVKTFNASKIKTSNELPDLNKSCSGSKCNICDFYKKSLEKPSLEESQKTKLLSVWNHHINWTEPCNGTDCNTCHYIRKAVESGIGVPNFEAERLRAKGIDIEDDSFTDDMDKFVRHINSSEPPVHSYPLNYGVPRIVPSADHPTGFIGEDPHSKYTETVAFVTDNPMHTCSRCLPICGICGTRDTPGRIKEGEHIPEYAAECRRRRQGVGFIPNYN